MSIFAKNIKILEEINPYLAEKARCVKLPHADNSRSGETEKDGYTVESSEKGLPVLRIGKRILHSRYDPLKEAKDLIEFNLKGHHDSITVLGLGLGYHISALLKVTGRETVVNVIEPRWEVFRCALEQVDMSDILRRVNLFIGEEEDNFLKSKHLKDSFSDSSLILKHPASWILNQKYFEDLLKKINLKVNFSKSSLKVLVVSPLYGGSLPVAGYCADALKKLGHKVEIVDNSFYFDAFKAIDNITKSKNHIAQLKGIFTTFLSEALMAKCLQFKPDLVFALAQAPVSTEVLARLREFKISTAFWFVEDFRTMPYWEKYAPLYDYFFAIQKGEFFEKLKNAGARNYHYLPTAASPEIHREVALSPDERKAYSSDLSFLGAGYYNRRNFFTGLLDLDFKIWGSEWDLNSPLSKCIQKNGARVSTGESVKIFNASKINLNLHSSTYHSGVNPYGDFVNPRTFELASCNSFQLVDTRSDIGDLFNVNDEIICFNDLEELREKIKFYLEHEDERKIIARKAHERVLREHTYEIRMEEMLCFVMNHETERWSQKKKNISPVKPLIEEAGPETELGRFLTRFAGKETISLPEIAEEIYKGEGKLSETESIFLLMREFLAA